MELFRNSVSMASAALLAFTAASGSGAIYSYSAESLPPGTRYGSDYVWCWSTVTEGDFIYGVRHDRFNESFVEAEVNPSVIKLEDGMDYARKQEERFNGVDYSDPYTEETRFDWYVDELVLLDYKGSDKDVTVPSEADGKPVTAIGANAFSGKSGIDSVTLPDSVDYISAGAFKDSSVKKVVLPEKVMTIPNMTFEGCENLETVTGLDHVFACADNAFTGTKVRLPEDMNYIEDAWWFESSISDFRPLRTNEIDIDGWGFKYYWNGEEFHANLMNIPRDIADDPDNEEKTVLPEKIGGIRVTACELHEEYAVGQYRIVVPEGYSSITAFFNKGLKSIEFLNKETSFSGLLSGTQITEISLPKNTWLTNGMFQNCKQLKSFTFPEGNVCTYFPEKIFANCDNLEKVVVPEGRAITAISSNAFMNDRALREVILPESASVLHNEDINDPDFWIESDAFQNCSSLESLTVPSGSEICINIGDTVFSGCKSLREFALSKPAKSVTIGRSTFEGCSLFDTLDIPADSVKIGERALGGTAVTSFTAGAGWEIGPFAFTDCKVLKNVTLNGGKLSEDSFTGCEVLENVDIKGNVQGIQKAFNDCPALTKINGKTVFDSKTGEFASGMKDMVKNNFAGSDNIGFINDYVDYSVKKTVASVIKPDMNDLQKARAVHDWICRNTIYATEDEPGYTAQNDASVFLMDSTTDEGYARAFNLLAREAGLETCIVGTEFHSWNLVKIGGLWFHVDTTWDDLLGSYSWFLRSDADTYDAGGHHKRWNLKTPSALHSFQCEELPVCSRAMGDVNDDGRVNTADLVSFSRYLLGGADLTEDDATVCDLNFDGSADTFDTVLFRRKLI